MSVAAILANCLSVPAIAEWGADQAPGLLAALGFPSAKTPCQSTLQRLFAKLDGDAFATALTTLFGLRVAVQSPRCRPGSGPR